MTEWQWLACTDPDPMVMFLLTQGHWKSDRKGRLFFAACWRMVWERLDERDRAAVGLNESLADEFKPHHPAKSLIHPMHWRSGVQTAPANLVREVFGNPFRPAKVDPSWLTWNGGTVVKLAEAIYQERELPSGQFDLTRLAVLADALEDAGCTDRAILDHCRQPGEHVRGCWVVDLLLGKE